MPTNFKTKKALLSRLPPTEQGAILELGSGWGTLVFPLAKHFFSRKVVGYELSIFPYWISKGVQRVKKHPNLHLVRKDFFSASFKESTLVICYLFPGAMKKLEPKFKKELPKGATIISNTFALPNWKPEEVLIVDDFFRSKIYIYKK